MKGLPGNQFIKDFMESYWAFGDQVIAAEGLTDATIVWQGLIDNARATLALAHEQRTANLIAIATGPSDLRAKLNEQHLHDIENEILERLGEHPNG